MPPLVSRERVRAALALASVALLPWLIAPGVTQPDTKTDLVVSPWRYLGRALSAWNDHAGLGELQNQAYGYLFPMGPVFGIGHSLGLPGWAVQRVWWSVLLLTAFVGMHQLIRRLGVAGPGVALLGGAAYALSPRVLTVLPQISVAAWPLALTPWLLLAARPLLGEQTPRRLVLRSCCATGLLTATLGGVNATASGIVLAAPFFFLLTHPRGRRRLGWWCGGALLGALWWLLPLVVLGRYAYPFLDFIETARITTAVTSAPNALRGASDWVAYILDASDHPVWQSGWVIAQSVVAIVATCAVAALGVFGLLRMRRSHLVVFALMTVSVGAVFMVVGHAGAVGSPISGPVRELLDGPLAPLRNVHKADPLIRVPLVLGLCALVQRLQDSPRLRARLATGATVLAVGCAMTPLWQGRAAAADGYSAIPQSWHRVAAAVDAGAATEGGSTLLLPSSRTAGYTWGATTDEPLEALATSPVVYRAAAPLGPPGATRILDAADTLAASGRAQPALAAGLARMGISRVVVRHDLLGSEGARSWKRVERTLRASRGFRHQRTFRSAGSTLSLWQVTASAGHATAYRSVVSVAGGPEAVFALSAAGIVSPDQGIALRTGRRAASADVITDSMPWRVYDNGAPNARAYGPTLEATDDAPTRIGAKQLPPGGSPRTQPTRVLHGMRDLHVTSSAADPFAKGFLGAGAGPAAAFDGDPHTAWLSGDHQPVQTMSFDLRPARAVHRIVLDVAGGKGIDSPDRIEVRVGGHARSIEVRGRARVVVPTAPVRAGAVSITLHAAGGAIDPVMGLRGVHVSGVRLRDVIAVPQPIHPDRQTVVLHRDPRSSDGSQRAGEDGAILRRQVTFADSGRMTARVLVRADAESSEALQRHTSHGHVRLACGEAGVLHVGDTSVPLALSASSQKLRSGVPAPARLCGSDAGRRAEDAVTVATGARQVWVKAGDGLRADIVTLAPVRAAAHGAAAPRSVTVRTKDPSHRVVHVGGGGTAILALDEGANAGWHAESADGHSLTPVTVDGWRQGFRLTDPGAHTVRVTYGPTSRHRLGLLAGLVAVLVLVAGLWFTRGRHRGGNDGGEVPRVRSGRGTGGWGPRCVADRSLCVGAAVVVGLGVAFLASGWVGLLAGAAVLSVPRRMLPAVAAGAMALAGVFLAAFGVVDAQSAGAIGGQVLGTVTLAALARAIITPYDGATQEETPE